MPVEAIRVSSPLPASAARVYAAWLDALEHSRMTGAPASIDAKIGGRHSAWDGYIEGEILELEPGQRIVQSWRSREFPEGHPPSLLEIRLRDTPGGCEMWISHSEIPEGQSGQYEAGWHEHYFIPMTKYFRETAEERETPRTDPQELAPVLTMIGERATPAAPGKPARAKGAKLATPKKRAAKKVKPATRVTAKKRATKTRAAKRGTPRKATKAAAKAKPAKKAAASKRGTVKKPVPRAPTRAKRAPPATKRAKSKPGKRS